MILEEIVEKRKKTLEAEMQAVPPEAVSYTHLLILVDHLDKIDQLGEILFRVAIQISECGLQPNCLKRFFPCLHVNFLHSFRSL